VAVCGSAFRATFVRGLIRVVATMLVDARNCCQIRQLLTLWRDLRPYCSGAAKLLAVVNAQTFIRRVIQIWRHQISNLRIN